MFLRFCINADSTFTTLNKGVFGKRIQQAKRKKRLVFSNYLPTDNFFLQTAILLSIL